MFYGWKALPAAIFSVVFVLGCATKLEPLTSRVEVDSPATLTEEIELVDLPVFQVEDEPKKRRPEKLYTLSVRNASIADILLSFSRESKENIVVDPDVRGKVTADLKDVTITQALDALLIPLNLDYHMESGFIRVSRPKMMTRLFRLDYVITTRAGSRGLSSNITGSSTGTSGGATGTTGGGGTTGGTTGVGGTAGGTQQGSNVSGNEVQDIFLELENGLTALGLLTEDEILTRDTRGGGGGGGGGGAIGTRTRRTAEERESVAGDRGSFSINRQAGIILITSYPDILAKAAELIEAVEGSIQRQVLIQAKIIEVTLNDDFSYGIDWSVVFDPRGDKSYKNPYKFTQTGLTDKWTKMQEALGGGFTNFTMTSGALNIVMQALKQQGKVKVLSSPKISTLNNQTAIIRATTEMTFFTTSTTFVQTESGVFTPETEMTPDQRDIGVTLDVTPQISASDMITMNIHPAITELKETGVFVTGSGVNEQRATYPILTVRETDTVVRVRDGETIVLGGLMQDKKTVSERKVPLLWRIPGVGMMCTSRIAQVENSDLVIFLTPTILLGERVEDYSIEEMERLEMVRRY
ncbi:MAG: secretin and TonB N-terminal domain-containing protein [Candidatus Brocadiales bacterium]